MNKATWQRIVDADGCKHYNGCFDRAYAAVERWNRPRADRGYDRLIAGAMAFDNSRLARRTDLEELSDELGLPLELVLEAVSGPYEAKP